ncbi:unnamed protein product [Adineta steineri]|uniref:Uncharacterized protein n=1 Tax=Adineta steineri TaxID=433720 RepID=A0A815R8K1_9BILA|nr:unnamed protein product [Adineta steineri]
MAVYNSFVPSNQDDGDTTLMSDSFFYDHPNLIKRINNPPYFNERNNPIFDDDDPLEEAHHIEQILSYYRKDLRQESYTQLDCTRKLIIRLFDFVRPAYTMKKKKMNDLNGLFEEISDLQDIRFTQQKDKHDQLCSEILHLKKLLITSASEGHNSRNTFSKVNRLNSVGNYEQWMLMEEETRQLQNLVELQRDRINELINLLTKEEPLPVQSPPARNIITHFDGQLIRTRNLAPTNSNNTERLLVATIQSLSDEQHDSGTDTLQRSTNDFHSLDTVNNDTHNEERLPFIASTLPPLSRISSYNDIKKCPICNYQFLSTANEFEIIHHVETCLSSAGIDDPVVPTAPKQYVCPNCSRQYQGNDEKAYLQHLTYCYAEDGDNF